MKIYRLGEDPGNMEDSNIYDTCAWTPNKIKYGLPMCVAHMHFSKQQTRSKWSMSAYIAMLCSSGAQCSVAVVTAQSHSSCSKVELNAL